MEELQRFLNSIEFTYTEEFSNTVIKKVVLNKETKVYNVYLKCTNVLEYETVTELFRCAKKGINGKDLCYITLLYENITENDMLEYAKKILSSIIFEHPSLMGLENSLKSIDDYVITLEVGSEIEKSYLNNYKKEICEELKNYGIGDFAVDILVNEEIGQEIREEIEASKIVKQEKKEDSPVIFGFHKDGEVTSIKNIYGEQKNIIIEGYIFGIDASARKGQKGTAYIINLKVSDKTDSFLVKFVRFKEEEYNQIMKGIKVGKWVRIVGNVEMDNYLRQMILNGKSIELIKSKDEQIKDEAEEKRVELHTHTMMSAMDGVIDASKLVKFAKGLGHKAVAVTDHDCLQSYPELYHTVCDINSGIENEEDKFKVIYGSELSIVNNDNELIFNLKDYKLLEQEYVVFDTETTGFTPYSDQMIEIGAVKIKNGVITDRFDELINPGRELPRKIVELTNITDEMLEGKDTEENVTKRFKEFIGDLPLVAHNAKFDIGFMIITTKNKIEGIITDRDIVIEMISNYDHKVKDYIHKIVQTIDQEKSVEDALQTMKDKKIKRLLVTNKSKVVGVISIADILNKTNETENFNTELKCEAKELISNKPYEEMTVQELQQAILEKMRHNGPVTEYMLGTVIENTHHGSLLTWVKSFR